METQEITIRVTSEAARIYQSASAQDRHKLDILLSLQLSGMEKPVRSLEEIMHEASKEAHANGLTPEILKEILDEA